MKKIQTAPNTPQPTDCLIYCRVSSKRQVVEGTGLESQEQRCRERARAKNYTVERVFEDDGVSGGLFERPAMKALLSYIDQHPYKSYVVIFDDLKRFARAYDVHKRLKLEFQTRGVVLECLNYDFTDTPEGEFVEGVLALQSELERKQNRRQVIQKQKARLERGLWPFCPPIGLCHMKSKELGKVLVPREPISAIFKEAIESYERNLLNTQQEVKDFVAQKYKEQGVERPISLNGVAKLLTEELYAGYIEYKPWGIERRDGQHEGFISKQTFLNVQDKIQGKTKPKLVKSYSLDFPLRGFMSCSACGSKLRASWNTGKTKKYPNYWCQQDGCEFKYKVTKAWTIEDEFEELLAQARVDQGVQELAKVIFSEVWEEHKQLSVQREQNRLEKLKSIDEQVENLAVRVSSAQSGNLIVAYEQQIEKLMTEKNNLNDVVALPQYSEEEFGTQLSRVFIVLENPLELWHSKNPDDKRTVLYMYFENGLAYTYKEGFGTPQFSQAIEVFQGLDTRHVEMRGNEPLSAIAAPTSSTDIASFLLLFKR